jgi:uncharacterized protein (TIGR03435 family)
MFAAGVARVAPGPERRAQIGIEHSDREGDGTLPASPAYWPERMQVSTMIKFLGCSLAGLVVCAGAFAAADVSGKWVSAPIYLVLKLEGNKLSGSAGPTEKEQLLTFDNGAVDGDRVTFKAGSFQFSLKLNGDELKGEMRNGADSTPVFLKRATDRTNAGPRSFEVASVKRSPPPSGNGINSSMRLDPGRLTCNNVSLKKLIYESYAVKDYQVSGPDWLNTEIYDITATLPPGVSRDDVLLMLQTLLAERFKLTLHRDAREMPVYALVVGKGGSKLQEVEFARGSTSASHGKLVATTIPIRNFTEFLSRQTGRPVLDMTGLKGFYSFSLNYTPEEALSVPEPGSGPIAESAVGPTLLNAIQEQLGLKLEARKAPVEILVVDHAEKIPTEN